MRKQRSQAMRKQRFKADLKEMKQQYEDEKEFLINAKGSGEVVEKPPKVKHYLVIDFITEKVLENSDQDLGKNICMALDLECPGISEESASRVVDPYQIEAIFSVLEEFSQGGTCGLKRPQVEDVLMIKSKGKRFFRKN